MSVIIRLQNLPLSAKSSDLRYFFRGLHIPDGGVHIVGGDKGDAFIAFNSDEDARIAMRKDRGKIKDSKIKLLLSSYMEMKHAIERITKYESSIPSSKYKSYGHSRQSPLRCRDRSSQRNRHENYGSYSPREDHYSRRSHSPRRSRSPYERSRSSNYRRSSPPRQSSPNSRGISPFGSTCDSYADSFRSDNKRSYHDSKYDEHTRNIKTSPDSPNSLVTSEEQRQLEERIAKALNTGFVESAFGISSCGDDKSRLNKQIPPLIVEPYPKPVQTFGEGFFNTIPDHSVVMGNQQSVAAMSNFNPGTNPLAGVPHVNDFQAFPPPPFIPVSPVQQPFIPFTGYYITISGLDPLWTNSDLQAMLKGIFAPQDNIKWEVDDSGFKTGTAFIKLMNKEDFNQILAQATYIFNNKIITVSECPNSVYEKYFPPPSVPPLPGQAIIQDAELYYKIKGLPFTITHEEIMHFFYGFQIADVYLECLPSGKMTGEGYICFTNMADYERARLMHGKKLGLAFIEMIPCTRQEMMDTKGRNNGFFNPSLYLPLHTPATFEKLPGPKRPLCALLTGLPFFIKISLMYAFFEEHGGVKPDAIHLLVNYKRKSTGRGYAEFTNIRDFDAALKCHGQKIGQNMICVKQVLYDEMTQILSTHKAKHDYADKSSSNVVPVGNLPTKSPHIWDPPNRSFRDNSNLISVQNNSFHKGAGSPTGFQHSFKKNDRSMDHSANRDHSEEERSSSNREHGKEKRFQNSSSNRGYGEEERFQSSANRGHIEEKRFQSPANRDHNEGKRFQSDVDEDYLISKTNKEYFDSGSKDDLRMPVKFEVKIKQSVAKNTKADEAFDRSVKNNPTLKLSKLTPEKEIEIVKVISNKTVKEVRMRDSEERCKSPPVYEKIGDFGKKNSFKRGEERKRLEKYSSNELDIDYSDSPERYRHQSPSPSRKHRKSYKDKYINDDIFGEVIVEMSNVHPLVRSPDLLDFFRGFDVTEDRMIRRYSDMGEPLGDIRVTFLSLREAEKAVKYLSGQYLNGIPVSLFIVKQKYC